MNGVRVTKHDGEKVYIGKNHIKYMEPIKLKRFPLCNTSIHFDNGRYLFVRETVETIK